MVEAMTRLASRMERLGTESAFAVLAQAQASSPPGAGSSISRSASRTSHPRPHRRGGRGGLRAGHTHYVPAPGILPLREAVSAFLERTRAPPHPPPTG